MKAIFAHSHRFIYNSGKYYSNGSFSVDALKRYTNVFQDLTILSRQIEVENVKDSYTLSSGENMHFVKVPELYSLEGMKKYNERLTIIENEVKNTDYVIARLPSNIGIMAIKYAKKHKKPYFIELVGCPWDALWNHSIKGKIMAPCKYYKTKKIVKEAPYVLYVTNEFLQDRYPTQGKQIASSNVVLKEIDEININKRLERIEKMRENDKIIIGTTGAIDVRYKGQEFIIKALGELKKRGISNFEYQLIGSGNTDYLYSVAEKSNVLEQVRILGSKPHDEVFQWLNSIDIYAQPSLTEGLPRAVIEAMSKALPAFGSTAGGIPELLEKEFVYENNRYRLESIQEILLSFDRENMIKQGQRNYQESKKYDKNLIEKKRNEFLNNFRDSSTK